MFSRPNFLRRAYLGVPWVLLALAGHATSTTQPQAQAQAAGEVYVCPGNLVTNRIDPAQAQARQCVRAAQGRLSLASPSAEAPQPEPRVVTLPAAVPPATRAPAPALAPAPVARRPQPAMLSSKDVAARRARDSDARAILESELSRTQAQLQALAAKAGTDTDSRAAIDRLRADEAALRREIARLPF